MEAIPGLTHDTPLEVKDGNGNRKQTSIEMPRNISTCSFSIPTDH